MKNQKKKSTGPRPLNGTGSVCGFTTPSGLRYTFRQGYPDGVSLRRQENGELRGASCQNVQDSQRRPHSLRRRPAPSTPRPARSIGSNALNLS